MARKSSQPPVVVDHVEPSPFPQGYSCDEHEKLGEEIRDWMPGTPREVSAERAEYLLSTFPGTFTKK